MLKNALYAQSGGVTAVINATACGVIEAARACHKKIHKLYAGRNGILGILAEQLIDTAYLSSDTVTALKHTPGGAFGSCRYKLKDYIHHRAEYDRLFEIFSKYNIGYFFYNGGGDSQDTAYKIATVGEQIGYPITCIGIPKTIDNDLPCTDSCPGYGSVAKYVAISTKEAALDVASMAASSTKVFILEVMGRHTGWIAAASGLIAEIPADPPQLILFPEIPFDETLFCNRVQETVDRVGYCVVVTAEGIRNQQGGFLSESSLKDAFGHAQLGGVAPLLAHMIKKNLRLKYHWAVSDYLQRSARHIASAVDVEQAYALGKKAVEFALTGKNAVMPILIREQNNPYRWHIEAISLHQVANQEKKLPKEYIREDGFGITKACKEYIVPLITGEAYPPYQNGLPQYITLPPFYEK